MELINSLMGFLLKLLGRSSATSKATPNLSDRSRISRWIRFKNHYKDGHARHTAFMPPRGKRALSVFETDNLSEAGIWALCSAFDPRGRADMKVGVPRSYDLTVRYDNEAPRHVSVEGLPKDKHDQMRIAQRLAEHSTLVLNPEFGEKP